MDFAAWSALSQADQDLLCQQLNPYEDWPLFKDVESEFVGRYGRQVGVDRVFCGMASGLGPCNAITVTIRSGSPRTKLPERFLGFPVLREYVRPASRTRKPSSLPIRKGTERQPKKPKG